MRDGRAPDPRKEIELVKDQSDVHSNMSGTCTKRMVLKELERRKGKSSRCPF